MEGKIQVNSGDVSIIAVKVDNDDQTTIPGKDEGYSFQKAECTNDAIGNWNNANWEFRIQKLTKTKTKCTLYFVTGSVTGEQSGENKMDDLLDVEIAKGQSTTMVNDDNNIRYIGKNPNNWVTFNKEKWRIIGLMDGIKTSTGKTERLLKIIRKDSLGTYNWDSSPNLNYGLGVNEWSQADLMYALKKYGGESTGLSSDKCGDKDCPTDWVTLNSEAQNMIETVVWNTGTAHTTEWRSLNLVPFQYIWERSTNHGKQCRIGGGDCNDALDRTTTWTGKVGLMYPSDYGYATDGGKNQNKRNECLYYPLSEWYSTCYDNDWLKYSNQWTMTPAPSSSSASYLFYVNSDYCVTSSSAYNYYAVRPVVYLKSNVKISGGDGSENSPYTLTLLGDSFD